MEVPTDAEEAPRISMPPILTEVDPADTVLRETVPETSVKASSLTEISEAVSAVMTVLPMVTDSPCARDRLSVLMMLIVPSDSTLTSAWEAAVKSLLVLPRVVLIFAP